MHAHKQSIMLSREAEVAERKPQYELYCFQKEMSESTDWEL